MMQGSNNTLNDFLTIVLSPWGIAVLATLAVALGILEIALIFRGFAKNQKRKQGQIAIDQNLIDAPGSDAKF